MRACGNADQACIVNPPLTKVKLHLQPRPNVRVQQRSAPAAAYRRAAQPRVRRQRRQDANGKLARQRRQRSRRALRRASQSLARSASRHRARVAGGQELRGAGGGKRALRCMLAECLVQFPVQGPASGLRRAQENAPEMLRRLRADGAHRARGHDALAARHAHRKVAAIHERPLQRRVHAHAAHARQARRRLSRLVCGRWCGRQQISVRRQVGGSGFEDAGSALIGVGVLGGISGLIGRRRCLAMPRLPFRVCDAEVSRVV